MRSVQPQPAGLVAAVPLVVTSEEAEVEVMAAIEGGEPVLLVVMVVDPERADLC